tara:strand:- start:299 stop:490 length:192 start_codon:yes stop_codon:yes gene_type:complete
MKLWRICAKALGEKAAAGSDEAGRIELIRTLIIGFNFITCFFILLNASAVGGRDRKSHVLKWS